MRILYVDDDTRLAALTARKLRGLAPDIQAETVSSVREALARLERIASEPLELVLTDVRLRDGDGLTLLRHIRENSLPLAVVIITGLGDEETAVAALKARADDYVVKRRDYLERLPVLLEGALNHYRADAARRARSLNILYVENYPGDVESTLRHFAVHAGHLHLDVVYTGPEALAALQPRDGGTRYDVILVRFDLHELNALEMLRELRLTQRRDIPAVLLCRLEDEELARQALKLGGATYLLKRPGYLYRLPWELEEAHSRAELLRRETALRREKEFSDTTVNSLPGVFYHYDATGRFLRWNENFEAVTGYSRDEIERMHPLDFFAGDDRALVEERIGLVFATGEGDAEAELVCKDGRAIPYYFTGRRALFDGEPYLVGVGIDIGERKRAEEVLRQTQGDLARMSRVTALGELAASIAHEVNQPLTSVIGNAEICLMWLSGEAPDLAQVREAISDIHSDGLRAGEVLKRIRNLVRKGDAQKARLDIDEVVGEVTSLLSGAAGARHVRVQTRLCGDLPQVLGDRVQLQQVLLNLMVNAMEAMSAVVETARELTVETGADDEGGGVLVSVRDGGPGLRPGDAEKVFGTFYTTKPEGMGMGLSISRSIIRSHGGRLWAEANEGEGACFRFTLPPAEVTP
ncbi:MAG: response regulator [Pyrinomonadaceae bacterium]